MGRRDPRSRMVLAHPLARSSVRDVGNQSRRVQGAVERDLRQRLRRGARKAGASGSRDRQARRRTRYRARRRDGRNQLHGLRAGCEHRTDASGSRKPTRENRSAAGTGRTPTPRRRRRPTASVSTRRSVGTSASFATHSTARFCGRTHGRRSRSTWTSALRPHRSCTTDGSTSCTTTMDSRFSRRSTQKRGRKSGTSSEPTSRAVLRPAGPRRSCGRADRVPRSSRSDAASSSATTPTARELWRLKGMTQATPSPVVADNLLYVGSGSQGEANRPHLRRSTEREGRHLLA